MSGWNFAEVWEAAAEAAPERTALVHDGRSRSWSELDRRADGLARGLLDAGLGHQDVVALALYNGPAYLEAAFAAMKAGLVPVNTNYRYGPDELVHLWTDSGARAVVFHGELVAVVEQTRARVPDVALWVHVDDGTGECPAWATPYADLARPASERTRGPWGVSGDDRIVIYTGGTTGLPKGVVWRQHDLYRISDVAHDPDEPDLDHVRSRVEEKVGPVGLPASPLMHGTGFVFASTLLSRGGTVVTLGERRLDVPGLLRTIAEQHVSALCIVGDAFARPIVDELDAHPGDYDVSGLRAVSSSGMVWSDGVKQRLLAHAPEAVLVDLLNSSEASGMGRSVTSARGAGRTGRFRAGKNTIVIDDENRVIEPGTGGVGRVAVRGILPLGYHNDPVKTAATFPTVDGERVSVPGDWARVEDDGSVTLLGRGSTSINTGGEKVFGEEVEDALRSHPDVVDAVVVGVPDERFGARVAAMVAAVAPVEEADLIAHVRGRLAAYKAPRHVLIRDSVGRGPHGKADHPWVTHEIERWLAAGAAPARA
ncbi:AMP-binding protein [Actinomycetospora chibensis]|uniref:AMP-binding protein n=1 Tax=Actinomycetospora chibensis TaxID=663606 RepID=A0ABV9RI39_9PSEU|nr:AMP-binding protein [Actinomycetospora chibensis]MDD7927625.1 AMP-binding protein [Actinomycetospora chibensis]